MYSKEEVEFALEALEHFGSLGKTCEWLGYPSKVALFN